ncbi:MAG: class I SAM-dependent RNA methyltransferase [Acutalibacter sp.]|jgi:putative N6-adenine-specific DNA methylase|uniref:THUMP domain-containing class I SAM-dependent RNA methyltransferase n=1 Tax=Acutalibacter sp. TaxID=1918636 RepID=UPI0021714E91|nr:class I SAM-dependent RNA methyltransferase [Acutalibacter sp.]MCI9224781.1 class I SAM-dependent RNA methyltransferase [Acutalibacter sp.]
MTYSATCLLGVEGLLAQELRDMGCEDVHAENGRVLFSGGWDILARANICSRFAERVGIQMGDFQAKSFEELFQGVKALPWEEFISREDAFPVSGSSLNSQLHSVPDCQAIIKKAVVERLKKSYRQDWFTEDGPAHRIRFRIMKDQVSVVLDTSGAGLHKRGYRPASNAAPIKETLAAALVKLSRLRSDATFYDPFCGSGTLLIEAATMAQNVAPGIGRRFQAEVWEQTPAGVWERERDRARSMERRDTGFTATGYDIDPEAVGLTRENAKRAGVNVTARVQDIKDFERFTEYGCVVCNPPYGQRLMDQKTAQDIYRQIGRIFMPKRGWSYGVITPDEDFEDLFGRRADKRRKLYNGMIRCQFYQYYKTT